MDEWICREVKLVVVVNGQHPMQCNAMQCNEAVVCKKHNTTMVS
jgi:hypothetical protein